MRASAIVVALTATLAAACSSSLGADASTSSADTSGVQTIDVADALQGGGLQFLCQYAGTRTTEPACQDVSVVGVCSQHATRLDDATASLMNSPDVAKFAKTEAAQKTTQQTIAQDFTTAIETCVNGKTLEVAAESEAQANDPELQALVEAGKVRFWHEEIRTVGRILNTADPLLGTVTLGSVARNLKGQFLAGVCAVGAGAVGALLSPPDGRQPSAECSFQWDQTRIAHCVSSGATVCSALGGFIDLGSWGLSSDDEIVNWLEDAADLGLETLCRAGGKVASIACGTINVAAQQIAMAIKTGDNDWAECLGVSQAATCLGEWIGAGGWTNDDGVAMPRQVTGADGNPWIIKSCCTCEREQIVRTRGWIYDTDAITATSSWAGVIQQGDFASGNCGVRNGAEYVDDLNPSFWDTTRNLHKYVACRAVDVVGSSCSLEQADANGALQSTPLQLWDDDANAPSQSFLTP